LPGPRRPVLVAGQPDLAAVERRGQRRALVPQGDADRLPRGHVPEPGGPFPPSRQDYRALGGESDYADRVSVEEGRPQRPARGRVPLPGPPVVAAGQGRPAVRTLRAIAVGRNNWFR